MSAKAVKIAISLPQDIMSRVEKVMRELGTTRSHAIFEAVSLWLKKIEDDAKDKQYAEGYRKKPESSEMDGLMKAGLSSFSKDKW